MRTVNDAANNGQLENVTSRLAVYSLDADVEHLITWLPEFRFQRMSDCTTLAVAGIAYATQG